MSEEEKSKTEHTEQQGAHEQAAAAAQVDEAETKAIAARRESERLAAQCREMHEAVQKLAMHAEEREAKVSANDAPFRMVKAAGILPTPMPWMSHH